MRVGGESNKSIKNMFRKSWEDIRALSINKIFFFSALFSKNASKFKQFMPPDWVDRQMKNL
jgi:glycosyltransferase